jgi:CRP/FNR family transcriptional regulator
MNRPMRLVSKSEPAEICAELGFHNRCFLCDLSEGSRRDFDAISLTGFYPRGAKLFAEGQRPKGVFILCSGRAKLSIGSSNGQSLMRIAEQGEILGLSATLCGHPYEGSAEMLDAGQVNFIRRDHFLALLNNQAEASLRVAQHLSNDYIAVHEQVRALALSDQALTDARRDCADDRRVARNGHAVAERVAKQRHYSTQRVEPFHQRQNRAGRSRQPVTRSFRRRFALGGDEREQVDNDTQRHQRAAQQQKEQKRRRMRPAQSDQLYYQPGDQQDSRQSYLFLDLRRLRFHLAGSFQNVASFNWGMLCTML